MKVQAVLIMILVIGFSSCSNKINDDSIETREGIVKKKNNDNPYTGYVERLGLDGKVVWTQYYSDGELNLEKSDTIFTFSNLRREINPDTLYVLYFKGDKYPYTGIIIENIADKPHYKFVFNRGIIDRNHSTPLLSSNGIEEKSDLKYLKREQNRLANGKLVEYHDNGVLLKTQNIIDGKVEGESGSFYEDGKPEQSIINRDNQIVKKTTWWKNGNIKSETNYKNGVLDGNDITYNEGGSATDTIIYKSGIPNKISGKYSVTDCNDVLCFEKITSVLSFISNNSVIVKQYNNFGKYYVNETGNYKIENNYVVVELSGESTSFEFVQGGLRNQGGLIFIKQ
jgi:antitoxin component YwqK of YwqJK toxin-antitoxin module